MGKVLEVMIGGTFFAAIVLLFVASAMENAPKWLWMAFLICALFAGAMLAAEEFFPSLFSGDKKLSKI